jgi:hypothetical protein
VSSGRLLHWSLGLPIQLLLRSPACLISWDLIDGIPDSMSGLRIEVEILLLIPCEYGDDRSIDPWFGRATGTSDNVAVWLEFRHDCRVFGVRRIVESSLRSIGGRASFPARRMDG